MGQGLFCLLRPLTLSFCLPLDFFFFLYRLYASAGAKLDFPWVLPMRVRRKRPAKWLARPNKQQINNIRNKQRLLARTRGVVIEWCIWTGKGKSRWLKKWAPKASTHFGRHFACDYIPDAYWTNRSPFVINHSSNPIYISQYILSDWQTRLSRALLFVNHEQISMN